MSFTGKFDFGGYATKINLKCKDGRTIKHGAFKNNDGQKVPLVFGHVHDSPGHILGHAILEYRPDGVYAYGIFNETPAGRDAKILVQHGDLDSLSIFANDLTQNGSGGVLDGNIRELSLVLAGSNPGAKIDPLSIAHGDDDVYDSEEEAIIYTGLGLVLPELEHADTTPVEDNRTLQDIFDSMSSDQQDVAYILLAEALNPSQSLGHSADSSSEGGTTVKDIFDSMTSEQQDVIHILITQALEDNSPIQHDISEGDEIVMKHNVFDKTEGDDDVYVSKEDFSKLFAEAKKGNGTFRSSFIAHAGDYGINDIEFFFPDAQATTDLPIRIARETSWVSKVLDGAKKTPFSRIKTLYADFKAELNRARGYVKGAVKEEGIITALKRVTMPTTVYHKQKLDKDDIDDIVDFDVVAFMKADMRIELDEEVARAALISDGRATDHDDKIDETCIRPIYKDSDVYVERVRIPADADVDDKIEAIIRSQENYLGSGNMVMFTTQKFLTDMLLLKDGVMRRQYSGKADLMSTLNVSDIVIVPVMVGVSRIDTVPTPDVTLDLLAILVNMRDYTFGANKGGALSLFDDFDIDVNQYKYLIETRLSGSLTLPKSAIVIEQVADEG